MKNILQKNIENVKKIAFRYEKYAFQTSFRRILRLNTSYKRLFIRLKDVFDDVLLTS